MAEPDQAASIMQLEMPQRRALVDELTRRVQDIVPGITPWAAITATLDFFAEVGWGQPVTDETQPGCFVSVVDAYVLEGLLRGAAIALDVLGRHVGDRRLVGGWPPSAVCRR